MIPPPPNLTLKTQKEEDPYWFFVKNTIYGLFSLFIYNNR